MLEQEQYGAAAAAFQQADAEGRRDSALLIGWATALAGDGKVEAAIEKLETALKSDPESRDAYLAEAKLLKKLGRLDDALRLYERASTFLSDDAGIYASWGELLAEMGRYEQARWKFESAIAKDKGNAPAHLGAGEVLLKLGRPQEAAERFAHVANTLDRSSGAAFSGWGRARFELDDYEGALKRLKKALELDGEKPASIEHLLYLGETLYELRRFDEGRDAYRRAIESGRKFGASSFQKYRALYGSAVMELAANSPAKALPFCIEGLELLVEDGRQQSPARASLHYVAGAARVLLKQYGDAIASFRRAAAASDSFAVNSLNAVAGTLAAQGKYAEAWGELRQLDDAFDRVKAQPGVEIDEEQYAAYGRALLWLDRLDEAEAALKSALGPQRRIASAWAKLMVLYLERREHDAEKASHWQWEAYEAYKQAVQLLEDQCNDLRTVEPVLGLGLLHFLMDDLDKAEVLLEEAVKLDSESMIPFAGLGMIRVRQGKYDRAVQQFELALKRDPDSLTVKCHLADAYVRLGHRDAALDTYEEVLRIAPANVGAQIGTGEILIEQAEEADDDLLYEDAEAALSLAIKLGKSNRPGSPNRESSSGLGLRQWADLYYSRGYARVMIYEAQMRDRIGQPTRAARGHLKQALSDFEEAKKTGVHSHRAARAAERVQERLKRFSSTALTDWYAPLTVVGITLALLLLVQYAFLSAGGFDTGHNPVAYVTMTLSLLGLLAGGFYLPQLLKLKLGGIQLEKATVQDDSRGLNVHRLPFQASIHATFEPEIPRNRKVERAEERRPDWGSADAKAGAAKAAKRAEPKGPALKERLVAVGHGETERH